MTRGISEKEFLEKFNEQSNGEYVLLSKYEKYLQKVKMKHATCGYEYEVTPRNFIGRNNRCPKCSGTLKVTHEEFLNKVHNRYGNEYLVIGKYKNRDKKLIFKHKKCGYEWETQPHIFLSSKHGCPKCSGNVKKKDTSYFKSEVYDLVKDEYEVLGEYNTNNKKIQMKHNTCGHVWNVNIGSFLQGSRCPKCNGGVRKTTKEFKEEVFNLVNNEYEVIGEYKNNITRIKIKHNVCNHVSEICPIDFIEGVRCLHCKMSRGEKRIFNFFYINNIINKNQYTFNDCTYKRELPFDFAIFNEDNELILLIEYDGEQHYKANDFFGGEEAFKLTKLRDEIKNTYCKENDIPLLRIPYWEFNNIEAILSKQLNKYNLLVNT